MLSTLLVRLLIVDKISKFVALSFIGYWLLSLSISTFEPMGYYEVSTESYCILLLGVLSFLFGFSICKNTRCQHTILKNDNIYNGIYKLFNNKFFIIFITLLNIYFLIYAKEALINSAIAGKAARVTSGEDLYVNNKLFIQIYSNIGYIVLNLLMTLVPFALYNYKKKYTLPIVLSIIYILIFFVINAGRVMFVILLLYIIFTYVVYKGGNIRFSFKNVIMMFVFSAIAIIGISYVTHFRDYGSLDINKEEFSESYEDTKKRILSYSVLPIVLFDRAIKEDYMEKFNGPLFGKATFAGPELFIGNAIKKVVPNHKTVNDVVINYIQDNYFQISSTDEANFAYTGIFFHYLDFGFLGAFIFPFLFGYIFRTSIYKFYQTQNLPLLALLGFMYFMMMYSIFTCYLIKPWVTFYIPFLLYWGTKLYKSNNINN